MLSLRWGGRGAEKRGREGGRETLSGGEGGEESGGCTEAERRSTADGEMRLRGRWREGKASDAGKGGGGGGGHLRCIRCIGEERRGEKEDSERSHRGEEDHRSGSGEEKEWKLRQGRQWQRPLLLRTMQEWRRQRQPKPGRQTGGGRGERQQQRQLMVVVVVVVVQGTCM